MPREEAKKAVDERDFDLILNLYELKSITRTAERMFLTQPAVTHRLKKIEKSLGGAILIRSKKGVIFTPLGEGILPHIRKGRSNLQDMKNFAASTRERVSGTLKLGLSVSFSHYKLPSILKRYTTLFPDVNVNIVTERSANVFKLLIRDDISLGILREEFDWNEAQKLIFTESLCIAYHREVKNKELIKIPYIGYKTDPILQRKIEYWQNDVFHSTENHSIWADNIATAKELVRQGIGWSLLPGIWLEDFEGYKEPVYFSDGSPFLRRTYALYRRAHAKLPQVREFLNLL